MHATVIVIVVPLLAELGPLFPTPSCTEPLANLGITVPLLQDATVNVKFVPLVEFGVNVQPRSVPAFVKSPALSPEILSLNESE